MIEADSTSQKSSVSCEPLRCKSHRRRRQVVHRDHALKRRVGQRVTAQRSAIDVEQLLAGYDNSSAVRFA